MSNINPTQRFLEQVLTILREEYPGETFTADMENEGSLKHEGFTLCLANLWSQYQQHLMDEKAQENTEVLRSLTKHFVQAMLNAPAGIGKRLSWAEAASKLYPFIVNMVTVRNLERDAGCPHFQLGGELALTLVLDFPDCIRYVLEPDLKDWNMAFEEALTRGLQNLDKLPVKLETVGKPPNGVVCLSTFDGYAGTRILAPGAQRKIGKSSDFRSTSAFPTASSSAAGPIMLRKKLNSVSGCGLPKTINRRITLSANTCTKYRRQGSSWRKTQRRRFTSWETSLL